MILDSLPIELVEEIAEHLASVYSFGSLAALNATCKWLRDGTLPILDRTLVLVNWNDDQGSDGLFRLLKRQFLSEGYKYTRFIYTKKYQHYSSFSIRSEALMSFPNLIAVFSGVDGRSAFVFRPTTLSELQEGSMMDAAPREGDLVYAIEFHSHGRLLQEEPPMKSNTTDSVMKSISDVMFNQTVDSEETNETHFRTTWRVIMAAVTPSTVSRNVIRWKFLEVDGSRIPTSIIMDEILFKVPFGLRLSLILGNLNDIQDVTEFLQDYAIEMKKSVLLLPLTQESPPQLDEEDDEVGTTMLSLRAD